MKKNMKKIAAALLMMLCVFVMTACSSNKTLENEAYYQSASVDLVDRMVSLDDSALESEITMYSENMEDMELIDQLNRVLVGQSDYITPEAYFGLLKGYESNQSELGAYIGFKEFEGGKEKSDGTYYYSVYQFEKHDMRLTVIFNEKGVVTTTAVDPILTTGEILKKAGMNTLIGMGTVFVVLIIISLIISAFSLIPKIQKAFSKKKEAPAAAPAPKAAPAPVAAPAAEEVDDLEVIAVITAAVAAAMGTSTDGFTVRSIKKSNKWRKA